MVRTPALSFEERIRRDTLSAILLVETSLILAASFLATVLLRQHQALIIALGVLASVSLIILLGREASRARRRLALAEVKSVKQLGFSDILFLPWAPQFRIGGSSYEVEIWAQTIGRAVFLDWRPYKVGEKILILLDRAGNLIAVNSLSRPVWVETLKKLV